jgi:phage terminase small subunit
LAVQVLPKHTFPQGFQPPVQQATARRLLQKVAVQTRLNELQREADRSTLERISLSREWVLEGLKTVAKRCMEAEPVRDSKGLETGVYTFQAAGANRALELLGKELGMFRDLHTPVWDGRLDSLTPARIEKLLEQLAQLEFPGDPQALEKAKALVDPLLQ